MNSIESRIYGRKTDLDYAGVKSFFDKRKDKIGKLSPLNLTMYQDKNPELALERDLFEKARFFSLFSIDEHKFKALDIGCGVGRWAFHLSEYVDIYLGFDYSADFINIAKKRALDENLNRLNFQILSATTFEIDDLMVAPPFDLFIVAGVMAYLNDDDCISLLNKIKLLSDTNARFYLREPIALENRLTLSSFYSDDMDAEYSAIYRTVAEYEEIFGQSGIYESFNLLRSESLFPDELNNRKETAQHIFIFGSKDA